MFVTMWTTLVSFICLVLGWIVGRHRLKDNHRRLDQQLSRDYFVGLNYLLNEQQDKAVDVFIKMLEVDSDTVETHLALGSLFRRRGEVDRAIRIHQNLIARPQLNKEQRIQALLELGKDYMRAGVLDRAERLFLEVVESGLQQSESLGYLLDIYEQEKEWQKAIDIARRIEATTHESMRHVIAHYYCELATELKSHTAREQAHVLLKRAQSTDRQSVRASLMQANLEYQAERYKLAIKHYQNAIQQDPEYISEIIEPLSICYERLNDEAGLLEFLQSCLGKNPRISVMIRLADLLRKKYNEQFSEEFIGKHLRQYPSLRGLQYLVDLKKKSMADDTKKGFNVLQDVISCLLSNKPIYRCNSCGFSGKSLHWQCPSCKRWSTVKPIHGLEGE